MDGGTERSLRALALCALTLGGLWLAGRTLLPWAAPFLLAFALAALMEAPVRFLARHGWRRGAAAGLVSLLGLGLLLWGAAALLGRAAEAVVSFARQAPVLVRALAERREQLESWCRSAISRAPEATAPYWQTALDAVGEALAGIPTRLSGKALEAAGKFAQASPDLLLFLVTAGIGAYFFSASYPRVLAFLRAQLPDAWRRRLDGLGRDLRESFGGYLRAQLILMALTFFELLIAFLALGVQGAAGLAALTALVDALPVFGTGTVLVPWALVSLLLGRLRLGLGLLAVWLLVNLVRNAVQARLLGAQIGLDPLASLLALYVGWRVWSVWGMLLFPLLLAVLVRLQEKGAIRLWRS